MSFELLRTRRTGLLALVVGVVLFSAALAGCDIGGGGDEDEAAGTGGASASRELENFDTTEWGTFGYSYDLTRHVPFDEITRDNVGDLGRVWSVDFKKEDQTIPLGQQTFPLVVDGTMYATTHFNHVFAMDAKTGEVKWHFKPSKIGAFKNFGLSTNRGVAYCNGHVYMLTLDMRIMMINAESGELVKEVPIWRDVKDAKPEFGYYQTVAPICYKGVLLIGSSGADNGVRGFFMGYNASDLSPAWPNPYWTVPPEGQDWRSRGRFHGGGTSWMPPSIDTETDIAYFPTANPSPDFFAALRPGNNPKVNAVIAVNALTGEEVWWRQQTVPDEWDYDTAQSPVVFTATVGGEERKVVSVASKEGTWWVYDAADGTPIYEGVKILDRIEHPRLKPGQPVDIYPSALGGINYAPSAFDPETNYIFHAAVESKATLIQAKSAADVDKDRVRGDVDTGAINGFGTTPKGWKDYGSLSAWDLNTGERVWKVKTDEPLRGGITVTESGLGFFGDGNGEIKAFDVRTGEILWRHQTGAQIAAAPTIYEIDGKQYIAISVGGTFTSSMGGTATRVDVFALGGSKQQGKRPNTTPPAAAEVAEGTEDAPAQRFLSAGQEPKTLQLQVVAALGAAGGGLNFNGYNRGGMTVTIPQGYRVNVTFKNTAVQSPHSVFITDVDQIKEAQPDVTQPAFPGSTSPRPAQGITSGTQYFEFTPTRQGTYAILCAVPGHAIGGQWNYLKVVGPNATPSIKLGNETVAVQAGAAR